MDGRGLKQDGQLTTEKLGIPKETGPLTAVISFLGFHQLLSLGGSRDYTQIRFCPLQLYMALLSTNIALELSGL